MRLVCLWHAVVLCVAIGLCVEACFILTCLISRLSPEAFADARHVLTCNDSNGQPVTGHDGQLTEVCFSLVSGASSLPEASKARLVRDNCWHT